MSIAPARAAFFDVDETLITCKSMACLIARYWGHGEVAARRLAAVRGSLQRQIREGVPREQVNRSFFRFLTGSHLDDLEACGREWYEKARAGGLLHTPCTRRSAATATPATWSSSSPAPSPPAWTRWRGRSAPISSCAPCPR
ncbi:hypothetical protein O1L60_21895 [Streptomyces diastatochromogenes]|nr:hypothetical protein [Streptomyces diastatochromogenes]